MGAQAAEKGIQVRNTGFAAGNWRFSAPRASAARGPCAEPDAAQLVRPSRRPSPGSPPAPRPALPRPQRAHSPPARLTRRLSLSDQAAAVPTAEARPPTAAASPRSPPPPPRRSPRAGGGACLTAAPGPAHTTAQWGPRTCASAPPHKSTRPLVGHASAHRARPPPPSLLPNLWSAQRGLPLSPRQGRPRGPLQVPPPAAGQ